jgi:hypothetical protein
MEQEITIYDRHSILRTHSLEHINNSVLSNGLVKYFKLYWNKHQWTQADMDSPIMSSREIQEQQLPVFHGLVLHTSRQYSEFFKSWILKTFRNEGISFNKGYVHDSIVNNSGEFTFVNINQYEGGLDNLLRGRIYDVIFIVQTMELIPAGDMMERLKSITYDKDPSRIVIINVD